MNEIIGPIISIGSIVGFLYLCFGMKHKTIRTAGERKKVEPYLKGVPYKSTGIVGNGFSGKLRVNRNSGMSWFIGHTF